MTSKITIDESAIRERISEALAGTAAALATAIKQSASALPVEITVKANQIIITGTGDLTPEQIINGAVAKTGGRTNPNSFIQIAIDQVDLAQEFEKRF